MTRRATKASKIILSKDERNYAASMMNPDVARHARSGMIASSRSSP
jgi:hypothetical protein